MTSIDRHNSYVGQGWQPLLMVLLMVLIAILPIIIFRDFTPSNELRYLSIADESLATGRWWAFTNHGVPYADKPPLYLWCIICGKWLLGSHQMWFYSLFSIIPAFVIAGIMYRWTQEELAPEFNTAALLMLFTCGLFAGMVFTLRMDMLMTMFILLALRSFRLLERSEEKPALGSRLLFALWIFLAVFSKGPMGILIPLLATTVWLLLTRRMRLWTRAWGWPTWTLLIVLCAGWFGAVYAEGGTEYLDNLLVHQTVGRAVNSFHHKRPFWYYLVSLTYTLLPWTFVIFGSIIYGIRKYRRSDSCLFNYFLVIVLVTFVLLSVISSKLQVYMLPAYPFMVYLAAMVCARHKDSRLLAAGIAIPAVILGIVGFAEPFITDPEWSASFGFHIDRITAIRYAGYALMSGSFLTLWYLYKRKNTPWAIETLSLTVLALVFVAGLAIRSLNSDLGYRAISEEALSMKKDNPEAEIMTWRIDRPENIDAYLKMTPFRIVEATDSMKVMPIPGYPAIVMTRQDCRREVPGVMESHSLGSKYVVLYCDTTEKPIKQTASNE
ncbi:MAG: dolichyl-phosphate-mannose--protein mannosyltransferase [Muribaculaceae bacterium]|nr:dolichyl-phosphate-mannose--protein mannosyltransferase [Muribaculaceae bacterium]